MNPPPTNTRPFDPPRTDQPAPVAPMGRTPQQPTHLVMLVVPFLVGMAAVLCLHLAFRSWRLALGTFANTVVVLGAAALVAYLGVNWVLDRAERAFFEDPAAVGRSLQELGQRVGIDSSVIDEWIENMRARLAQ